MANDLKTTKKPVVSVVMSVYNGEKFLKQAIDSVVNQSFTNFEFIIIDDGSTDKTLSIIKSYRDKRIVLISRENKGLVASLNEGIKIARGTYIARQDADDISLPSRLEKQVEYLRQTPSCVLVGTRIYEIDEKGGPVERRVVSNEVNNGYLELSLPFFNPIAHGTAMFRRSHALTLGGYDKHWFLVEDYELWTRMTQFGRLGVVDEELYQYRVHDQGVSMSRRDQQEEQVIRLRSRILANLSLKDDQRYFIIRNDWSLLFKQSLKRLDVSGIKKLHSSLIVRKDKKSILLVSFARTIGGGEIYMQNLRRALRGWNDIDLLVPNTIAAFLDSSTEAGKVKTYPAWMIPLNFKGAYRFKTCMFWLILAYYRAQKYDVINTQQFDGAFIAAAQGMAPILCTAHAHLSFDKETTFAVRKVFRSLTKVVYVAQDLRPDLVNLGVSDKKMTFVPNGVDGEGLLQLKADRARNEIVWVGRVEQIDKNPKLFVQLAELSQQKGLDYKFAMFGVGTALAELKEYAKKNSLRNIRFAGFERDKSTIYKNASVLCITSVTEAMPLNMLEAFSAAVPVVSTDVGDVKSVLTVSRAGVISTPTTQDFMSKIEKVLQNKHYPDNARNAYLEHYSLRTMGQKMKVIFDDLSMGRR